MQLASHPSGSGADTPLIIKPRALGEDAIGNPTNTTELNLDIPVSNIENLSTNVITVKNGIIQSSNLGFSVNFNNTTCPGCIWLQPSAYVYLSDVGDNAPSFSANEDCGWWHSGSPNFRNYQLNQMLDKFNNALDKLSNEITNLKNAMNM